MRGHIEGGYDNDFDPFEDNDVRRVFISKVYAIITVSLAIDAVIILLINLYEPWAEFAMEYRILGIVFFGLFLICYILFMCFPTIGRSSPTNIIFYVIMVLLLGLATGFFAVFFEMRIIMYSFFLTVLITLILTIIAICIPIDLTTMGGALCALVVIQIIIVSVLAVIGVYLKIAWMHILIAGIGVAVVSIIMVYDTQLIIGGKFQISEEDYLLAAMLMVFNILSLFRYILILLASLDD